MREQVADVIVVGAGNAAFCAALAARERAASPSRAGLAQGIPPLATCRRLIFLIYLDCFSNPPERIENRPRRDAA